MRLRLRGPRIGFDSIAMVNRHLIEELSKLGVEFGDVNVDFVIRHFYPEPDFDPDIAPVIWVQANESHEFPAHWAEGAKRIFKFWTYSHFVREQALKARVMEDKVDVLPLGTDPEVFTPGLTSFPIPTEKRFKFLYVGSLIHRKGVDLLLQAFLEEFKMEDDVVLIFKSSYYNHYEMVQKIKESLGSGKVLLIPWQFDEQQMASFYRACDCYVQPYRAEGFGLPMLEAMACGVPLIAPNWGPVLDFANPLTASLISMDLETLRKTMRIHYQNSDKFKKTSLLESEYIRKKWTHEASARWVLSRLECYRGEV